MVRRVFWISDGQTNERIPGSLQFSRYFFPNCLPNNMGNGERLASPASDCQRDPPKLLDLFIGNTAYRNWVVNSHRHEA